MSVTYKDAGVDIDRAEGTLGALKSFASRTPQEGVLSGVGGFGGLFALQGYEAPVLVSGTDGVGTKLLVALQAGEFGGLGQDLVAMCANDILCAGAKPLFFLDYFATGELEPEVLTAVVEGVADACAFIGCALLGGETAELPGLYAGGHFDLAGFCVGAVERAKIVDGKSVKPGDVVVGLASTGVHANGLSLARKVLADAPEQNAALLKPTALYGPLVLGLLDDEVPISALAHITGGGLPGNLPRALPKGLGAQLDPKSWNEPEIFGLIRERGPVEDGEMARTFNLGIGMCVVVPKGDARTVVDRANGEGTQAFEIGTITEGDGVSFT